MVNINGGGQYSEHLERMGDAPGSNLGKVDILTVTGQTVVAESAKVTLLEQHSLSAEDVDGTFWFFPVGSYVMRDHQEPEHKPVTDGGR